MLTVYTTSWCGYCHRLKRSLEREGIAYTEVNIEDDESGAEVVMSVNGGNQTVPTVVLPNGVSMTNPSLTQVKAGLSEVTSLPTT
ncbi:MAG: mycoredoxin [Mycobacteriales bacterium]|jgi:mycoredoxin